MSFDFLRTFENFFVLAVLMGGEYVITRVPQPIQSEQNCFRFGPILAISRNCRKSERISRLMLPLLLPWWPDIMAWFVAATYPMADSSLC